jgi:hypothetical protein
MATKRRTFTCPECGQSYDSRAPRVQCKSAQHEDRVVPCNLKSLQPLRDRVAPLPPTRV